jgi:hypothetical protein
LLALLVCGGCEGGGDATDPAFNRSYVLTIDSLQVAERNPAGEFWDSDGSPPDPYVQVVLDGNLVGNTDQRSDTLSAVYGQTFTFTVNSGSTLELTGLDADVLVGSPDVIMSCSFSPLTAAKLNSGDVGCTDARSTLRAHLTAR